MESKVLSMLMHLLSTMLTSESAMQRSLAARDGFAYSLLWATGLRGINAREAHVSDFWLPATSTQPSQPLLPSIHPVWTLAEGSTVHFVPRRLKTSLAANSAAVPLTMSQWSALDPLRWLQLLMLHSQAAGSPVQDILVRPLSRQGKNFTEAYLQSSSLLSRMRVLFKGLGSDEGGSLHSFRRDFAQRLSSQAISDPVIMQLMLIKTPAVLRERYLPTGRHHSGVKRTRADRCALTMTACYFFCWRAPLLAVTRVLASQYAQTWLPSDTVLGCCREEVEERDSLERLLECTPAARN